MMSFNFNIKGSPQYFNHIAARNIYGTQSVRFYIPARQANRNLTPRSLATRPRALYRTKSSLFFQTISTRGFVSSSTTGSVDSPDLIIVGFFGLAGACGAIAARENGSSVVILDSGNGGGASALSGGLVYAGGGTRQQVAAGCEDTSENMLNYLKMEVRDAVDEVTLKRFCDESRQRLDWLEKHGAKFDGSLCPYKTSFPSDKHFLLYSGNEIAYPYSQHAKPAPRAHRMVHPGFMSGSALWLAASNSAKRLGATFVPACRVESVIVENGRVCGVRYRTIKRDKASYSLYLLLRKWANIFQIALPQIANLLNRSAEKIWKSSSVAAEMRSKSVLLSAGGFASNFEMRQKYLPEFNKVPPLGTITDDGGGIKMGQAAGGTVSHLDRMSAWRFFVAPTAFCEGVTVGENGERIAAEDLYGATFTEIMIRKHRGRGYLILDSVKWEKAMTQRDQVQSVMWLQVLYHRYWNHKKASTLEDLASKLGVEKAAMSETIRAYNAGIQTETGDPAKKSPKYCSPILKPPFYGIDISIRSSGIYISPGITLGGLRVNGESGLVINEEGIEIPGLYAAGRTAVGVCSNSYVSGLSLADCVFSGKRAGEHAARIAKELK